MIKGKLHVNQFTQSCSHAGALNLKLQVLHMHVTSIWREDVTAEVYWIGIVRFPFTSRDGLFWEQWCEVEKHARMLSRIKGTPCELHVDIKCRNLKSTSNTAAAWFSVWAGELKRTLCLRSTKRLSQSNKLRPSNSDMTIWVRRVKMNSPLESVE